MSISSLLTFILVEVGGTKVVVDTDEDVEDLCVDVEDMCVVFEDMCVVFEDMCVEVEDVVVLDGVDKEIVVVLSAVVTVVELLFVVVRIKVE